MRIRAITCGLWLIPSHQSACFCRAIFRSEACTRDESPWTLNYQISFPCSRVPLRSRRDDAIRCNIRRSVWPAPTCSTLCSLLPLSSRRWLNRVIRDTESSRHDPAKCYYLLCSSKSRILKLFRLQIAIFLKNLKNFLLISMDRVII